MPAIQISAATLYNLVTCPHRVTMDLFGNPAERDEINPFVELLWERGVLYEQEVMRGTGEPCLDLSEHPAQKREQLTTEAMSRGAALIYAGRIRADDLLGVPDLLRRTNGGYVAGDIKSGAAEEGPENRRKPKKPYAVQLALYTDILERKGLSAGRKPFIWDVHGEEVLYDLDAPQGPRTPTTLWQEYEIALAAARAIYGRSTSTRAAYSAECKLCHWYTACLKRLQNTNDLTLVPECGRAKRDVMADRLPTIADLATADLSVFQDGRKTAFKGISPATLQKLHERAKLSCQPNAKPYLTEPITLPRADTEVFFDVEVDPLRDICYLHGFIERRHRDNATERYVPFFVDNPSSEGEEKAFAAAWRYLRDREPSVIYYYSPYERTTWRKLREKYPDVGRGTDIEALFDPRVAVDLYTDVVRSKAEFPTIDYSIKTLARFFGFGWHDPHPSGAASIQWYDEWVKTRDPSVKQRILQYNEDDCRATRVVLDRINRLTVRPS